MWVFVTRVHILLECETGHGWSCMTNKQKVHSLGTKSTWWTIKKSSGVLGKVNPVCANVYHVFQWTNLLPRSSPLIFQSQVWSEHSGHNSVWPLLYAKLLGNIRILLLGMCCCANFAGKDGVTRCFQKRCWDPEQLRWIGEICPASN